MTTTETAICPDCGHSFDPNEWPDLKRSFGGSQTPGVCPDCKDPNSLSRSRKGEHPGRPEMTTCCSDCGKEISYTPKYEPGSKGRLANKPEFCGGCAEERSDKLAREAWQNVAGRRRELVGEEFWRRPDPCITPMMGATSIADPRFNLRPWEEKVKSWPPTAEIPTLGLLGHTGTCKTRMGLLKIRLLLMEDAERELDYRTGLIRPHLTRPIPEPDWDWRELGLRLWQEEAIGHGIPWENLSPGRQEALWESAPAHLLLGSGPALRSYAQSIQGRAKIVKGEHLGKLLGHVRFEEEEDRDKKLQHLSTVPYLMIDELGKAAENRAQLPRFKLLIEYRMEHGLCTIWTANTPPEHFLAHGGEEYCLPLARRLAGENSLLIRLSNHLRLDDVEQNAMTR